MIIKNHSMTFTPLQGHDGPEGEQRYTSTLSLTSALNGSGWSTPRPGRFTPGRNPVTHQTGVWIFVRFGLDKCRISRSRRDSIHGLSSPYRIAILSHLSRPTNVYAININVCLCVYLCVYLYIYIYIYIYRTAANCGINISDTNSVEDQHEFSLGRLLS
jgi:hypothetical protein